MWNTIHFTDMGIKGNNLFDQPKNDTNHLSCVTKNNLLKTVNINKYVNEHLYLVLIKFVNTLSSNSND